MIAVNKYIGIPFKVGGRDREGCDCWGLVRLVLKEQCGISVPSLSSDYATLKDGGKIAALVEDTKPLVAARQLPGPVSGAVVVIKARGLPMHVGLMIDERHVLHVGKGYNAIVEKVDGPRLKGKIEGYYSVS